MAAASQIVSHLGNLVNSTSSFVHDSSAMFASAAKGAAVPNDLYAGFNWDGLTYGEQLWAKWYMFIGDKVLATGIMSFLLHEIFYFGRCIPWYIIDSMPYFKKWKIQEDKVATPEQQWKALKYVLFTHFTIEMPQIVLFEPMATYFGMATYHVPFPSWSTMIPQIIGFFFFEDFFHYWAHRGLHWGPLYKKIHKLHHEFSAPFGLAAEYAHPLEILILGTGTVGGPILWCALSGGNLHVLTMYIWIILRLFQAVDAHSGYDFPWSLQKFFPLWSGADHHDHHHQYFIGCYSTSFRIWDWVFGTDKLYRQHRKKQRDDKLAAKKQAQLKAEGFKTM